MDEDLSENNYTNLGGKAAIVVTSIASPNEVLRKIASDATLRRHKFYVIGDVKSPDNFELSGCEFYGIDAQRGLNLRTAQSTPVRHYARKNIGYLLAMRDGASIIIETDDDNLPGPNFYLPLNPHQELPVVMGTGWLNVYRYFSDALIWPRGLPLDTVHIPLPRLDDVPRINTFSPIQQGLADDNPDVDAIYRLLLPLPITFRSDVRVALGNMTWCPFNSQNTTFFEEAFPLLYLPAYCSFRMTDIWRSFVAQRICWENEWTILFREATVTQFRNDHRLMKDFADEISGYLHNRSIGEALDGLNLKPGLRYIPYNMRLCYESLVSIGVVAPDELPLLEAWLADLDDLSRGASKE
jgi:hypothetical protein